MTGMLGRYKGSVANRIIFWLVVFSILAGTVVTAVQFYFVYERQVSRMEKSLAGAERSYMPSVSRALWIHDTTQLEMLVEGIEAAGNIVYVCVSENDRPLVEAGTHPGDDAVVWNKPITFVHRGTSVNIGRLLISADLSNIHQHMLGLAVRLFATNMAITVAVAIFVYFVFSRLVTRHLGAIADQLSGITAHDLGSVLKLQRPGRGAGTADEFDLLVSAFNGLRERLRESQRTAGKGRDELKAGERRYRSILDEMLDTYYRTNAEGWVTMVTPSMYDLLGWHPEEALGHKAAEFYVDTEDHRWFLEAFKHQGGAVRGIGTVARSGC
ncbi:PAS domain S-box protein [Breoghania sp.]|uniref:PAS domain S-box protein n=1 Tax=Breoghania sp. TaxID=2065378 RepID=UPI0026377942|nr:PAS domain S-box protein [Breoghania sp.]MDJ0931883.1 PAS domain S-box protein [Breoghania sp.]